jgi:hypothetical protein
MDLEERLHVAAMELSNDRQKGGRILHLRDLLEDREEGLGPRSIDARFVHARAVVVADPLAIRVVARIGASILEDVSHYLAIVLDDGREAPQPPQE